jgi:hypothetical protein
MFLCALTSAVIFGFHPTHALVVICFIFPYLFKECIIDRIMTKRKLLTICFFSFLLALPSAVNFLSVMANAPDIDHNAHWLMISGITNTMNPVDWGLPTLAIISIYMITATVLVTFLSKTLDGQNKKLFTKLSFVMFSAGIFFIVQIVFSRIVLIPSIASLAFTRTTAYVPICLSIVLSYFLNQYNGLKPLTKITAVLTPFLLVYSENFAPPFIASFGIQVDNHHMYQERMIRVCGIIGLGLLILYDLICMANNPKRNLRIILGCFFVFFMASTFALVGIHFVSVMIFLAFIFTVSVPKIEFPSLRPLFAATSLSFFAYQGYPKIRFVDYFLPEQNSELAKMLERHVPIEHLILTLPIHKPSFRTIVPIRESFVDSLSYFFVLYDTSIFDELNERLKLLGIDYTQPSTECSSLEGMMRLNCRRWFLAKFAREPIDEWRENIEKIKKKTPNLSHALVTKNFVCEEDKIIDQQDNVYLIDISQIGSAGCKRLP